MLKDKIDWQKYFLIGILGIVLVGLGFSINSLFLVNKNRDIQANFAVQQNNPIKLPANIQSSAPINFKTYEEEVEYYKKTAKNPNNLNIEQAIKNMDSNLDGQCDKCGMAILYCIENGMEDM